MSKTTTKEQLKAALGRVGTLIAQVVQAASEDVNRVEAALSSHAGNKSNPHGVTPLQIGAAAASHSHSNYVPTARKVNGKALSADISLTAADVGALSTAGGTLTGPLIIGGMKLSWNAAAGSLDFEVV